MIKRIAYIILIASSVFLSVSCDRKMVYEKYVSISESVWNADSLVSFSVDITNTKQNHNLYFDIRNSVDYSFSNLWLFLTITPPKGEIMTDTVEVSLANPSGKWYGTGHGKFRDNQIIYRRNVYFPNPGQYIFSIKHGMRNIELKGISDIGIRIEKVN